MTKYLLDTSVLIDYSKRVEPTLTWVQGVIAAGEEICTCAVVVAEFYSGLRPADRPVWDAFLGAFLYLDLPWDVAVRAGADRHRFARVGQPLAVSDVLIAAAARAAGAVVVTANVKDFPMTDVQAVSVRT